MPYSANLTQELHAAPVKQLLIHLFPPQTISQLSTNYRYIHEALFLSTPEELATLSGVGSKSIRKILAFRELSHRIDVERSSQIKTFFTRRTFTIIPAICATYSKNNSVLYYSIQKTESFASI